jgi:exopolyphosphatase/guanosine-5'-triphosphate,3'-diphosphate pyrophosphatase
MPDTAPAPVAAAPRTRPVAVIDVGGRAIRLDVSEIASDGQIRLLESLQQPVNLGRDTFSAGSIDPASIEQCVVILRGFRHVMSEYGITTPDQIRAVATSSVREAANREAFLDRVYVGSGLTVDVLEDAEVEHLVYLAIHDLFEREPALQKGHVLIAEVGGGSTRVLLIEDGYVIYSGAFKLGSVRIRETLETYQMPADRICALLDQHILRTVNQMRELLPVKKAPTLIALAGDMETAMRRLLPGWGADDVARIKLARFTLAEKLVATPPEKLMQKHRLPPQDAETAGHVLLIYDRVARAFGVRDLLVTPRSMRRGLLMKMAGNPAATTRFSEQLAHSAVTLGRKYHFDERHALQVAECSMKLFRELQREHGLDSHQAMLLRTAAILHDVGAFVSNTSHHKHSMYLILNSELFGLTQGDNTIVALVARYHRRSVPRLTHPEFLALDREHRMIVTKLAALLRVADALDRNHMQYTRSVSFAREEQRFIITLADVEDVTLERVALKEKGSLFESIFGLQIVLRTSQTVKGSMYDA